MKTLRTLAVLVVIGAVAVVLGGCSNEKSADGAATAEELFAAGAAYLEDSMADVNMEDPPWEWSIAPCDEPQRSEIETENTPD